MKSHFMQKTKLIVVITAALFVASCGSKTDTNSLTEKKAQLEELKKQQEATDVQIDTLEAQIARLDPASAKPENAKLVAFATLAQANFSHYIDLQGKVTSDDIYYATPRNGVGGQVKSVYVKQGDNVKKGQLLLKLDDAVYLKNLKQLETQLAFAKDIYQRRKNLWDQQIGTEIELKSAENNVNQLEDQIATTKEQWSQTNVYSEVSGVANQVNVRPGEIFTGFMGQSPQIEIVNNNSLKIQVQVPETYIGKVHKGSSMTVTLPDVAQTYTVSIYNTGNIIDPNSRSFYVEAKLPAGIAVKPNQVAQAKILDYSAGNAIAVPLNILQTDENGKFVLKSVVENGRTIARKQPVAVGELYGDKIEIKSGLNAGDKVITQGYESVYDGQLITDK